MDDVVMCTRTSILQGGRPAQWNCDDVVPGSQPATDSPVFVSSGVLGP